MGVTGALLATSVGLQLYANKQAAEEASRASAAAETQAMFNARQAELQAEHEAQRILGDAERFGAEQRVGVAKSGVTATGSTARVLRETFDLARADVEAIKAGAGYRAREHLLRAQEERRARRAGRKGYQLTQAATLISGGALLAERVERRRGESPPKKKPKDKPKDKDK
jgi:hypothetical protein